MPNYRIHRLKDSRRNRFRLEPHTSGEALAAPGHYEADGMFEAPTPYALWSQLQTTEQPLVVGDLIETAEGDLRIFKYVGFEKARWEVPAEPTTIAPEPGVTQTA